MFSLSTHYSLLITYSTDKPTEINWNDYNALSFEVFGVPTFIVSGELFWGNDRIVLLRHYLTTMLNK